MGIRSSLFVLFLYLLLVWVLSLLFLRDQGTDAIIRTGLIWTAAGIGGLLAWLLFERVLGWWRLRRARAKLRPVPEALPTGRAASEDEAALTSLIAEADGRLAQAAALGGQPRRVRDFPIYLILGPSGAGKTSLVHNAGVDAQLLAGQVTGGAAPITSTRTANIWLLNYAIYIELGGRLFQGDLTRFIELLRAIQPDAEAMGLSGMWRTPAPPVQLRGVLLCQDGRAFQGSGDPSKLEQQAQLARERLLAIANRFGVAVPVYTIFTRTDSIPYFNDFFNRLPDAEADQPFGVLSSPEDTGSQSEDRVWAEAETRRLSRYINDLFLNLNSRRLLALTYETTATRKPAIYEFPREFKRIRTFLVQYLVDVFRPDPLSLNAALRGLFFVAVRKVARASSGEPEQTQRATRPDRDLWETTKIFRPDATQIFTPDSPASRPSGAVDLIDKWAFVSGFFQQVIRRDNPPLYIKPLTDPKLENYRRFAVAGASAFAVLATILWTVSCGSNRMLIQDVREKIEASEKRPGELSLASLRGLDGLRQTLSERLDHPHALTMGWGLYTGGRLREAVRQVYFERLRAMILEPANLALNDSLSRVGASHPEPEANVRRRLRTHLTIAPSSCPVDAEVVGSTLKETVAQTQLDLDENRRFLVNQQIDYYVKTLETENPVKLTTFNEAIGNARDYLKQSRGAEQIYSAVVSKIWKTAKFANLHDRIGDYKDYLTAPDQIGFEFTREGRQLFDQYADAGKFTSADDACVIGTGEKMKAQVGALGQVRDAKNLYYQRYKDEWKKFLAACSVRPYRDAGDAANKLDTLAGPSSPLLALIKFVSDNTYFPAPKAQVEQGLVNQLQTKVLGAQKQNLDKASAMIDASQKPETTATDVMRVFQPAQLAEAPDAKNLVTEKNKPYVDGLRALQQGMDRYARASESERTPLIQPANDALALASNAEKGLADGFNKDTEGVDGRVSELLTEPIRAVRPLIPANAEKALAGNKGKELAAFCRTAAPVFAKYPLNPNTETTMTLGDLSAVFAPGAGLIWKYEQASLGELLAKNAAGVWDQRPDVPKPRVSPEMLALLNRAQQLTDAFFPGGAQQPHLQYILRPVAKEDLLIKLEIDGATVNAAESSIQKTFDWPAHSGAQAGATGTASAGAAVENLGKYAGPWAVFQLFKYADSRPLNTKIVTWSKNLGVHGELQPITPVRVEFVQFPGGMDLFNPRFFAAMKCPSQAIVEQ